MEVLYPILDEILLCFSSTVLLGDKIDTEPKLLSLNIDILMCDP